MTTEWPRPVFPNDYLTAALISESYVLGAVTAGPTGDLGRENFTLLQTLDIVPGTLYEFDLIGQLYMTVTGEPVSYAQSVTGYLNVVLDTFDPDATPIDVDLDTQISAFTTFSSGPGGSTELFNTGKTGFFFADPEVYIVGATAVIKLQIAGQDDNGAPEAELTLAGGFVRTILGVRAVGTADHITIYS